MTLKSSLLIICLSSLYSDLILPRMRGGRSLDNLHRVSLADGGGDNQPSLGEPGTFVSQLSIRGSGIIDTL